MYIERKAIGNRVIIYRFFAGGQIAGFVGNIV